MRSFLILVAFVSTAAAQTADPRPSFQLADIHRSAPSRYPAMRTSVRGDRYEIRSASMAELVAVAYGVETDRVLGGPNWLDANRYDVIAKAPPNTPPQAIRLMLRSLLEDRFGLAVLADQRPAPAFVLSVGNGKSKLRPSEGSDPAGCQRRPQEADSGAIPAVCHGLTMEAFAQQLRTAAGDYLVNPVVDQTELTGVWDFSIRWTPRSGLAAAGSEGITIFDAVEKQLGLKLEAKQAPAPVIVVDRVSEKPTPNAADVSASLPTLPAPQFEVATIRPTDPQFQGVRIQTPPNGLVNLQGLTLGYLIQTIWFVTPEMIAGAPKWLDSQRWDISAKVTSTPGSPPQIDMESLIAMVRTLLEERFKLKTHMETREAPVLTLKATAPMLQKANPANRSGCREGMSPDQSHARQANPANPRLVSCRNMTMSQFAEKLPAIANALNPLNGPIRSAVMEATGLEGAWDFSMNFAPTLGLAANPVTPAPPDGDPAAPSGALSLAEALRRQLGLELAVEKRATTVLVIDHIDPAPSEN